jgi:mycoredoxin
MEKEIIVYGRPGCFQVRSTRAFLEKWAIPHKYLDIRQDPEAATFVRETNRGNESVPTLVFSDGTTLTEPTQVVLKAKLEELGYTFQSKEWSERIKQLKRKLTGN